MQSNSPNLGNSKLGLGLDKFVNFSCIFSPQITLASNFFCQQTNTGYQVKQYIKTELTNQSF